MIDYIVSLETAELLKSKNYPIPSLDSGQFWYSPNKHLVITTDDAMDMGRKRWRAIRLRGSHMQTVDLYSSEWIYAPTVLDLSRDLNQLVSADANPEDLARKWLSLH